MVRTGRCAGRTLFLAGRGIVTQGQRYSYVHSIQTTNVYATIVSVGDHTLRREQKVPPT